MAYKELIKNFSKIRSYLKEFFVYGYNARGSVGQKSDRSYDDEKRRIKSYLSDYVEESHCSDGKTTALSIDVRNVGFNPLYRAWKSASFTDKDITLHFILMDILTENEKLSLTEIISIIEEYLADFENPLEFDESTIRKKLLEYEKQGLIEVSKDKNKSLYSLNKNIELLNHCQNELKNALDFASEILPCGILGSTLLDKMEKHENNFSFKHHYITQSMDAEIMLSLFDAMRQKKWVQILTYNERKNKKENARENHFRGSQAKLLPLKILCSSQTGRQYLVAHVLKRKEFKAFRLDNIIEVKIGNVCSEYDAVKEKFTDAQKYLWGVSFGNFKELQTVEFTVKFREDEEHIYQRLLREKRCGKVERLSPTQARYSATVWDVNEMIPWIRTFIMRLTDLHISDKETEERFWADLYKMRDLYDF